MFADNQDAKRDPLFDQKSKIKRVPWECPYCTFQTNWPAARELHSKRHAREAIKAPSVSVKFHPTQSNPNGEIHDDDLESVGQPLRQAADPKTIRDMEKKCGYYQPKNPRSELPFAWICHGFHGEKKLWFPMRIEWLLCPCCRKPTAYNSRLAKPKIEQGLITQRTAEAQTLIGQTAQTEPARRLNRWERAKATAAQKPQPLELRPSEKKMLEILRASPAPKTSGELSKAFGGARRTTRFALSCLVERKLVCVRLSIRDARTMVYALVKTADQSKAQPPPSLYQSL